MRTTHPDDPIDSTGAPTSVLRTPIEAPRLPTEPAEQPFSPRNGQRRQRTRPRKRPSDL
jgi:hypothetical protein